ncbi:MAG: hypothetical protein NTX03_07715 [Bacteroidetes bacterium]|nr:hypothetical protein [Bacteroidota bacterium]
MKALKPTFVLLVLFAFSSCEKKGKEIIFQGRVIEDNTGKPIKGVKGYLTRFFDSGRHGSETEATALSDDNGICRLVSHEQSNTESYAISFDCPKDYIQFGADWFYPNFDTTAKPYSCIYRLCRVGFLDLKISNTNTNGVVLTKVNIQQTKYGIDFSLASSKSIKDTLVKQYKLASNRYALINYTTLLNSVPSYHKDSVKIAELTTTLYELKY